MWRSYEHKADERFGKGFLVLTADWAEIFRSFSLTGSMDPIDY